MATCVRMGGRVARGLGLLATVVLLAACGEEDEAGTGVARDPHEGLPAFQRVTERLAHGGRPVAPAGFVSLKALGFDTIVCVEGREPDVEAAAEHGLKSFHVPLGFGALSQEDGDRIAAAADAASTAAYIYCDDGSARGPTAAMLAWRSQASPNAEDVLLGLQRAGVPRAHSSFYRAVVALVPPTPETMQALVATIPSRVPLSGIVKVMLEVHARWRQVEAWAAHGWERPPAPGPTLGGPAPAPQPYAELSVEQQASALATVFDRLPSPEGTKKETALFRQYQRDASMSSRLLELALRKGELEKAGRALGRLNKSCELCHGQYRK